MHVHPRSDDARSRFLGRKNGAREEVSMRQTGKLHQRLRLFCNGSNPVIGLFSGNARYWEMSRSSGPSRGTLIGHLGI
jgi:hypothetical protein